MIDFDAIARKLAGAEPIKTHLTPYRAFTLVALLHLALRHPAIKTQTPSAAEVASSMATNLTAKLGEIDPEIATALNQGWDTSLDCTPEEFDRLQAGKRLVIHNAFTLYEGEADGKPGSVLSFNRPQDWSDRTRWHYNQVIISFPIESGIEHVYHCHLWQETARSLSQACAALGNLFSFLHIPGQPWQLCGREFLGEEDFWFGSSSDRPPIYQEDSEMYD